MLLLLSLIAFYVGLHLPKSFTLYFLFLLIVYRSSIKSNTSFYIPAFTLLSTLIFSVSYSIVSIMYGFWSISGRDALDLISMLVLPILGLYTGSTVTRMKLREFKTPVILLYGLGSLSYSWLTLIRTRLINSSPNLLDLYLMRRDNQVIPPWGLDQTVNVRSVEQTAAIAVTWFIPGLLLCFYPRSRIAGFILTTSSLLGLAAVACFHGRLGYIMLPLGGLPLLLATIPLNYLPSLLLGIVVTILALSAFNFPLHYIYDERFERFFGFLSNAAKSPWGGNTLHFSSPLFYDSRNGDLMHNVFMDVYVRVGLIPTVALLCSILPLFLLACYNLAVVLKSNRTQLFTLLSSSLLICLAVQWLFQPLIFGDGLLFFISFALLGFLASSPHELQP